MKVRGDSPEMAFPNTLVKGAEAVKGPLPMVLPYSSEAVFPKNVSLD